MLISILIKFVMYFLNFKNIKNFDEFDRMLKIRTTLFKTNDYNFEKLLNILIH